MAEERSGEFPVIPVGCHTAKTYIAFEAITDKVSKKVTAKYKTPSVTYHHQKNCNQNDFSHSIPNGMKESEEALIETTQQQTDLAQYQAIASVQLPMKKEFNFMLHENVEATMTSKIQKRAVETQEMANTKRRLAIQTTESILRERNYC